MTLDDRSKQRAARRTVARGVLARARLQLSQAAYGALSGGLEALGGRLSGGTVIGPTGSAGQAHAHRLREVVERDRALMAAKPDEGAHGVGEVGLAAAPLVARGAVVAPPSPTQCDEPIRTRTMAKLLALQGHRQRALSIYDYLLAEEASDETLRAEAERLRNAE